MHTPARVTHSCHRFIALAICSGAGEAAQGEQQPSTVEWPHGELDTIDAQSFYLEILRLGIEYGPHFRMVCKSSGDGRTAVLRCGPLSPASSQLIVHAPVTWAAAQTCSHRACGTG